MCNINVTQLLCLNTAGLQSHEKHTQFCSTHLYPANNSRGPDIFCIQEAHCTQNTEKDFLVSFQYDCTFGHGTESSGGLIIGFHRDLDYCVHGHFHVVGEGRGDGSQALLVHCMVKGTEMVIVNVYLHPAMAPTDRRGFFISLADQWCQFGCPNIICCGDFNSVMDPQEDTTTPSASLVSVNALSWELRSFVETHELVDSFRLLNPHSRRVTHFHCHMASGKQLDYFFVAGFFLNALQDAHIHPRVVSDHNPITITLQLDRNVKGRGYWKFPDALLDNDKYVNWMRTELKRAITLNERDTPQACCGTQLSARFRN